MKLLGGSAAVLLRQTGLAQQNAIIKLSDNTSLLTGFGCNVLLLTSPDGALMVDSGSAEKFSELLKQVNQQADGKAVRILFNTHWHADYTGSNAAVRQAGGKIFAHENTRLWMGVPVKGAQLKAQPQAAWPTDTFYTKGSLKFGTGSDQDTVQYGYLPQAHTDGDIYVFLPKANVLMASDVVSVSSYPILDYTTGGWIGGMLQAVKTLLTIANADTKIIPGTGPVQSKAGLQAQHDMLAAVMDRLLKLLRQGMSAKDMIEAAPTKDFDAKWGNPERFIRGAYPGLWGHVRELGGIV